MNRLLFMKIAAIFMASFAYISCTAHPKSNHSDLIMGKDSIGYSKFLTDSILDIIQDTRYITCKLQALNPVDSVRSDSVKVIPQKMNAIVLFLFFDSNNFKSNRVVYGHFSSSARFVFKASKKRIVYLEFDFGLRKWRMLDATGKIICISDMEETNLQFLRLVRLLFPRDITLNLMFNNLTVTTK